MAFFRNSFEGTSNGVALTQGSGGNTGGTSGDFYPTITTTGSPTIEGSTAQSAHGTKSAHINGATATTAYFRRTSLATGSVGGYFYFRFGGSLPGIVTDLLVIRSASANVISIGLSSGNLFQIKDSGQGGSPTTVNTPGWTVPSFSGTAWYRCEFEVIVGTTVSNGTINVRLYALDSGTALSTCTFSGSANQNTGTIAIDHTRLGKSVSTGALEIYIDDDAMNTGTTTIPSLPGANVAPVASWVTTNPLDAPASSAVHVQGQVADSDGNMATTDVTMTYVSGPNSPLTPSVSSSGNGTPTVTQQADLPLTAAGTHVVRIAGVDSTAAPSNNADLTIYTSPAANTFTGVVAASVGAGTTFGSPASALIGVTDASDATGIQSSASPVVEVLGPFTMPPHDLGPITCKRRLSIADDTAPAAIARFKFYKFDGTTLIDTAPDLSVSSETPTDFDYQLSSAAHAAVPLVSDRRGLKYTITVNP